MTPAVFALSALLAVTVVLVLALAWSHHSLRRENELLAAAVDLLSAPTPIEQVTEFQRVFGAALRNIPTADIPDEERELRIRLIGEEFEEVKAAIASGDIVQIASELADLLYVVYGTALTFGIDLDAVVSEVHASNMSKVGDDGRPIISDGTDGYPKGKVLKGKNYRKHDVASVLAATASKNRPTRAQIAAAATR